MDWIQSKEGFKKNSFPLLAGAFFLFWFVRVAYLFFLDPYYFSHFAHEELLRGTIAQEFFSGPVFPIFDYRPDNYSGGWLIISSLAAIFYTFLGSTFFALKCAPILIASVSLLVWIYFLARHFHPKVAVFFSLFVIFSPPSMTHYSVSALGDHQDTLILTGIILHCLFRFFERKKPRKGVFMVMGFVSGLGIWMTYSFSLMVAAFAVTLFVKKRDFFRNPNLKYFIGTFFLGLLPWFLSNVHHGFDSFSIFGEPLWMKFDLENFVPTLNNIRLSTPRFFISSFGFPIWGIEPIARRFSNAWYPLFFLLLVCAYFVLRRRKKEALPQGLRLFHFFSWTYTGILFFVLQLSEFRGARFFIPLYPILFANLSYYSWQIYSKLGQAKKPFFQRQFLLLLIGSFLMAHSFVIDLGSLGRIFQTKSYDYQLLDLSVCERRNHCFKDLDKFKEKLSTKDYQAIKVAMTLQNLETSDLQAFRSQMPESLKSSDAYFRGRKLAEEKEDLMTILLEANFLPVEEQDYLVMLQGILDEHGHHSWSPGKLTEKKPPTLLPDEVRLRYWAAIGQQFAGHYGPPEEKLKSLKGSLKRALEELPPEIRRAFLQGVGKNLYYVWSVRAKKPLIKPHEIQSLFSKLSEPVFEGIGMGWAEQDLTWHIAPRSWYWNAFTRHLSDQNKEAMLKGRTLVYDLL